MPTPMPDCFHVEVCLHSLRCYVAVHEEVPLQGLPQRDFPNFGFVLEGVVHTKLQLARAVDLAADKAKGARAPAVVGIVELRRVCEVKALHANLDDMSLVNGKVLDDREVEVLDGVAAQIIVKAWRVSEVVVARIAEGGRVKHGLIAAGPVVIL